MKIKLNKEQVAFINGLDNPEAKKEFLINCFLHQCEEQLKYDGEKITTSCDEPKKYTLEETKLSKVEIKNNLHKFYSPGNREKFDKFIEDNGLKKFAPPESKENLLHFDLSKPVGNQNKIFKEQYPVSNGGEPMVDVTGKQVPLNHESLSKERLKDITKPKTSNIEDIVFNPVGSPSFRYKLVLINNPESNTHGFTFINGAYYEKININ